MSNDHVPPGRPVDLIPAPKGLWWVILGGCTAVLAPMFGFLIGTILTDNRIDHGVFTPMYLGLFLGFVLGGLGLVGVLYGGWNLYRHYQANPPGADAEEGTPEPAVPGE